MDLVLRSSQIHSTFSQLGYVQADGYHVNENCNSALETILHNILEEDKYLRTYRRSISFCQNIQKDIIPLLIHAKDDKTVELIIKILVNLTIPIECLQNVNLIVTTDFGRLTIFEIGNLLTATKVAFTDLRASKALMEFLRKNVDVEQKKLSEEQRTNTNNCLLLLRNILYIPEDSHLNPSYIGSSHSIQNKILWNIFSQRIDEIIFKSMTISDAKYWGVTMVQLVALLYQDQHIATLQKLLYNWVEASVSEISEDYENNTSSPYIAWEHEPGDSPTQHHNSQAFQPGNLDITDDDKILSTMQQYEQDKEDDESSRFETTNEDQTKLESEKTPGMAALRDIGDQSTKRKQDIFETSVCGYGTQIDNKEPISASNNNDDLPTNKPVHQKPSNAKHRPKNKSRLCSANQERKMKKIIKRAKANNIIYVWDLPHNTPDDDDISNVLKEFTVDFLLKGFNSLVRTLHNEILTNRELQVDTSHFFWLITFFLKFATQIELDLELIDSVLSFEILSYLTSEGVNLCEQFELVIKMEGCDLAPYIRRQHLVIRAIQEFVQVVEVYKQMPHLNAADHEKLRNLEIKMCESEDLRSMFVLLVRHFNPKYHTKQYLQDLIVTNHILLTFLDNAKKIPDYDCPLKMANHIQQFASTEVMAMYGLLLEDYPMNGKYVNDCIFTVMHHVGAEALITLIQPNILNTFADISKTRFKLCDDWSDIIRFATNAFLKKADSFNSTYLFSEQDEFKESKITERSVNAISTHSEDILEGKTKAIKSNKTETVTALERWTEEEISSLNWIYLQCSAQTDVIGTIIKQLKEDSIEKTRQSVIKELFKQNLISVEFYESQLKGECYKSKKNKQTVPLSALKKESQDEEILKLCEQLLLDGKLTCLEWVQNVLLEICYTKLQIHRWEQKSAHRESQSKLLNFEIFRAKHDNFPVFSPVVYHSLIACESVALVPWNCEQALICKERLFQQLLSKLGFQMPAETGQPFIRIPHYWTADYLFRVAGKICSIDASKLKFSMSELYGKSTNATPACDLIKQVPSEATADDVQLYKQNLATNTNFTPSSSPSFKSESEEELNWLQVVKKSQQCKIILKSLTETPEDVMQSPSVDRVRGMQTGPSTMLPGPSTMLSSSSALLSGPSAMLFGPSAMLSGPSAMHSGPPTLQSGPSTMMAGPYAMLSGPSALLSNPSAMMSGPSAMLSGPSTMLSGPSAMLSSSSTMPSGSSTMLPSPFAIPSGPFTKPSGPSASLSSPSAILSGPSAMLSDPSAMLSGSFTMPSGPSTILPGQFAMPSGAFAMPSGPIAKPSGLSAKLSGPSAMLSDPSARMSGSSNMLSGPSTMLPGPFAMPSSPFAKPLSPSALLSNPSAMLSGSSTMLPGPSAMLSGPSAMLYDPTAKQSNPSAKPPVPSDMLPASPSRSPVVRHASQHVYNDQYDRLAARSHQAEAPRLHRTNPNYNNSSYETSSFTSDFRLIPLVTRKREHRSLKSKTSFGMKTKQQKLLPTNDLD